MQLTLFDIRADSGVRYKPVEVAVDKSRMGINEFRYGAEKQVTFVDSKGGDSKDETGRTNNPDAATR